jgi:hypothetical protein
MCTHAHAFWACVLCACVCVCACACVLFLSDCGKSRSILLSGLYDYMMCKRVILTHTRRNSLGVPHSLAHTRSTHTLPHTPDSLVCDVCVWCVCDVCVCLCAPKLQLPWPWRDPLIALSCCFIYTYACLSMGPFVYPNQGDIYREEEGNFQCFLSRAMNTYVVFCVCVCVCVCVVCFDSLWSNTPTPPPTHTHKDHGC